MYYGKTTPDLEKLEEEYYNMFCVYPSGHMEIEYGADEYEEYMADVKKALKIKKKLTDFVE